MTRTRIYGMQYDHDGRQVGAAYDITRTSFTAHRSRFIAPLRVAWCRVFHRAHHMPSILIAAGRLSRREYSCVRCRCRFEVLLPAKPRDPLGRPHVPPKPNYRREWS